ncbi:bifunctional glutamate N-acetyltransferase/amino-acid acetyltransferase ArgJ [Propionibacterium australiense]|uniref:Arginine biosynthesis bifunctional protein ArgJ n=1 Tax=Propionibacterium australiense TaxID=119981 RepID=A0A383S9G9_9ACTN|nr:bifunctional glutamate N-acetyltransferase/amino-acid acetyltransferase ArgJ [Propionibacterium australiense]RLP06503.1 bifunctional glutamate N-acetyltransferase/amino-acid acetyltransferase ArgJ [Propionibacterium australiense]RLP06571.1 bifunctional glutamate N-acetyltransferase/amino-acid acetyltransferase ArgJ [Propionibacterium australiense]SYZ34371.1 glutamate N-acetyltransferase/amino-acid N-acetyltransferase [Propionibacterium australiense]VEH92056.1 Glutamate N-acetyltransferase [P
MTVTEPKGFRAAGVAAGIKGGGGLDLAVVVNDGPADVAAGVFTSNRVCAAPVIWSREALADGVLRAVVLNSGGANACTGEEGLADSAATADGLAGLLGVACHDVAVCSTGLIGERLPMAPLLAGVGTAVEGLSVSGGADAARAIMTTDTRPKTAVFNGNGWSIGAMAKGAGMLAPAMATMLVVITTDAVLTAEQANTALRAATEVSFNRLDSDGCQSTNDTVLLLSSGASGVELDTRTFTAALTTVCLDLGAQLLGDAEGSSHDIEILVKGAAGQADALEVGRAIARSNLFKCAIFGNDPNWGRVLSTVGTTKAVFDPDELDVSFNGVMVCRGGAIGEDRSLVDLSPRRVSVVVDLHAGREQAMVWTNDLTYDYVKENAEYST